MLASFVLASLVSGMLGFAMFIISLFLILLILVQRGRGGGLTGALGGPGGQSAFGTKAGDLFTRITSFVAIGWITLCAFTMWLLGPHTMTQAVAPTPAVSATPADKAAATKDFIDLGAEKKSAEKFTADAEITSDVELTPAITDGPSLGAPAETTVSPAAETPAATETPAAETTEENAK